MRRRNCLFGKPAWAFPKIGQSKITLKIYSKGQYKSIDLQVKTLLNFSYNVL